MNKQTRRRARKQALKLQWAEVAFVPQLQYRIPLATAAAQPQPEVACRLGWPGLVRKVGFPEELWTEEIGTEQLRKAA